MDKLKQATEYVKSGNKIKAKQLLGELIQSEPNNELAWLWMSSVVDNATQQRYCLEQVIKINPGNQHALTGLSTLNNRENQSLSGEQPGGTAETSNEPAVEAAEINGKYKSQPLPDISTWPNRFTGWGIWPDVADTGSHAIQKRPHEVNMGLLIIQAHVASKRILSWATLFVVIAIILAVLALFVFGRSNSFVPGI